MPGVPLDGLAQVKRALKGMFRKRQKTSATAETVESEPPKSTADPEVDADASAAPPPPPAGPARVTSGFETGAVEKDDDRPTGQASELEASGATATDSSLVPASGTPDVIVTPASAEDKEGTNVDKMMEGTQGPAHTSTTTPEAPREEPESPKPLMSATSGPLEDQPAMH